MLSCAFLICSCSDYPKPRSEFNGRWRIHTASLITNAKPMTLKLTLNGFAKDGGKPTVADGHFHAVESDGYVDEQSVSVESDHKVKEIDKIRGKIVYIVEYEVSAKGDSLKTRVASFTSPNGQEVRGETSYRRKGKIDARGHLVEGDWERETIQVDEKSDWILRLQANRFSMRTEGGVGYDAVIGGAPVKIDGDNSGAKAQITMPASDFIVETDLSAKGVPEARLSLQLLPDGNVILAKARYGEEKNSRSTFKLQRVVK